MLPSGDDWYVVDDNKVVTETTISNKNTTNYKWIHNQTIPYWIRVQVATIGFENATVFAELYFNNRSGTYDNNWILIDFNRYFEYKDDLKNAKDIIWFVEEFYGYTAIADVT